jgi:hypothetical protein
MVGLKKGGKENLVIKRVEEMYEFPIIFIQKSCAQSIRPDPVPNPYSIDQYATAFLIFCHSFLRSFYSCRMHTKQRQLET